MADDANSASDVSDHSDTGTKEDAETTATRRELKQTSISEKSESNQADRAPSGIKHDDDEDATIRARTPVAEMGTAPNDELKEQVSSPKKKRAHDQLDEQKEVEDAASPQDLASHAVSGSAIVSRTDRSEPEKKRPRDKQGNEAADSPGTENASKPADEVAGTSTKLSSNTQHTSDKTQTSTSAFANSGFAKLASSSTSPFGAFGASGKTSVFGSGSSTGSASPFGSFASPKPAAPAEPPKLTFGGGATAGGASPFGILNGKSAGFGSALGGGGSFGGGAFGGGFAGPRLSSFAKPGEDFKKDKPAKPFGAPDSDEEEGSDDNDEDKDGDDGSGNEDGTEDNDEKEKDSGEAKAAVEDKKKPKLQKVVVDDGEAGEVTLMQVRAKMYQMEKGVGWKERGAGMLKVNAPRSSVEFDEYGNPRPESFDASVLDDDDAADGARGRKSVRLILRQDHTLRVILNSAVLPTMDFELNKKLKASLVLFTAFEGGQAYQVQMKMTEINATNFTDLMHMLQKQLRDV